MAEPSTLKKLRRIPGVDVIGIAAMLLGSGAFVLGLMVAGKRFGAPALVGIAALGLGALAAVVGLAQLLWHFLIRPRADRALPAASIELRALVRSLAGMVREPGEPQAAETAAIRDIVARASGRALSDREIRAVAQGVRAEGGDVTEFAAKHALAIRVDVKALIVDAGLTVAAAQDGTITAARLATLRALGKALRLPDGEVEQILQRRLGAGGGSS
jgi:hypothetical protein